MSAFLNSGRSIVVVISNLTGRQRPEAAIRFDQTETTKSGMNRSLYSSGDPLGLQRTRVFPSV